MRERAEIKAEAKDIMRSARVSPYVMTLILLVIGFVLDRVQMLVEFGSPFFSASYAMEVYRAMLYGDSSALEGIAASLPAQTGTGFFFFLMP